MNKFQTIITNAGKKKVAIACGVAPSTVTQWFNNGKLPETEYIAKGRESRTHYAEAIAKLAKCKRVDLL